MKIPISKIKNKSGYFSMLGISNLGKVMINYNSIECYSDNELIYDQYGNPIILINDLIMSKYSGWIFTEKQEASDYYSSKIDEYQKNIKAKINNLEKAMKRIDKLKKETF